MHQHFDMVHKAVRGVPAKFVHAHQQQVATDPQHRNHADLAEHGHDDRHGLDQAAANFLR
ncbi:hypothetical protein D3C74_483620 [compost metagenome]